MSAAEFARFTKCGRKSFCPCHMTLDRTCDDTNCSAKLEGKVQLALRRDAARAPYAISQKQFGIFFEDINASYEVFVGPEPGTFKGHGQRTDIAEAIRALKPKFMRFPGGCIVHGGDIANTYRWKVVEEPAIQPTSPPAASCAFSLRFATRSRIMRRA